MWRREPQEDFQPVVTPEPARLVERAPAERIGRERAAIGRSITIRGEVTGDEDLLIQGRVDGSVSLAEHVVTVGPEGVVVGDISARVVVVEGTVDGNLTAQEQVTLQGTARVEGDIAAPRVRLEDGAYFRGGVDMGDPKDRLGFGAKVKGAAKAGADGLASPAGVTSSGVGSAAPGGPGSAGGSDRKDPAKAQDKAVVATSR